MNTRLSRIQIIGIAVAILAFGAYACTLPSGPSPVININNNLVNTVTIATPNTGDTGQPGCATIGSLKITYPETLAVGSKGPFSVTPQDAAGNDRSAQCDLAAGIAISAQPSDVVGITDSHAFDTELTGLKAGVASVSVTVGVARANVQVTVK